MQQRKNNFVSMNFEIEFFWQRKNWFFVLASGEDLIEFESCRFTYDEGVYGGPVPPTQEGFQRNRPSKRSLPR